MVIAAADILDQVKDIVLRATAGRAVTVYLFGSHARGAARRLSDVDVAIDSHEPLPGDLVSNLVEALEESTVPCHVDVVDLSRSDPEFVARVKREGVVWTNSRSA